MTGRPNPPSAERAPFHRVTFPSRHRLAVAHPTPLSARAPIAGVGGKFAGSGDIVGVRPVDFLPTTLSQRAT